MNSDQLIFWWALGLLVLGLIMCPPGDKSTGNTSVHAVGAVLIVIMGFVLVITVLVVFARGTHDCS